VRFLDNIDVDKFGKNCYLVTKIVGVVLACSAFL